MARQSAVLLMSSARVVGQVERAVMSCVAERTDAPVDADDRAHCCERGLDVLAHRIASSSLRAGLAREELECDGSPLAQSPLRSSDGEPERGLFCIRCIGHADAKSNPKISNVSDASK